MNVESEIHSFTQKTWIMSLDLKEQVLHKDVAQSELCLAHSRNFRQVVSWHLETWLA